jgi:alpha-beta hydrolase superfamily lysophospholipase
MNSEVKPIRTRKQVIFKWIKIVVIIYCLVGIGIYYLQEKFMFHPTAIAANTAYNFNQPFTEINIPVDEKTNYNLIQFTTPDSAKGVVLYFHGNMDNVQHYAAAAKDFTSHQYEVWMVDYPGFGKSTGKFTEQGLYQQALQVYKLARTRFNTNNIIIYGRSLGSGIATQLASIRDCRRLILETPYYSLTSLASRFFWMYPIKQMVRYKIPTNEYLSNVTAPVTIFHGTDDGVIPFTNAHKLAVDLKKGDEFITIEKGSHNDLRNFPVYQGKLSSILAGASL